MRSSIKPKLSKYAYVVICCCVISQYCYAGMMSTEQIDAHYSESNKRQFIDLTLLRNDVKQALLAHGVNPAFAQQRVNQLTDQEIQQLAREFEQLPAASGIGLVLFATGPIVFMLELIGYTDLTTTF